MPNEVNSKNITLPTKVCLVKAMALPVGVYRRASHTMKRAEHQESMLSNCGAGEDPESPLDCEAIKHVNRKRNQPQILTGRTDAEAEAPILWPPDAKS